MGKTKVIVVIVLIIIVGGASAFYIFNKTETNRKLENKLTPLAEDYFQNYMSANTGSNIYEVTLKDLKKANEEDANYDLSIFSKCQDDTTVKITIDYNTGKVTKTETELNCK